MLRVGERAWLVDGGSGTMQRCARMGVDPRTVDGLFYSHRHPDHCGDLVPLLFALHATRPPRARDLPIWAGEGFTGFLSGLRGVYGRWIDIGPPAELRVTELSLSAESRVDLGDLVVRTRPAVHGAGALHLRFEAEGRSVVFSGDTAASEELIALAEGADLLVCECAGPDDDPIPGHLTPRDVAEIARRARPREIWLTHLYPGVDPKIAVEAVSATGVPTRRADDGDVWAG